MVSRQHRRLAPPPGRPSRPRADGAAPGRDGRRRLPRLAAGRPPAARRTPERGSATAGLPRRQFGPGPRLRQREPPRRDPDGARLGFSGERWALRRRLSLRTRLRPEPPPRGDRVEPTARQERFAGEPSSAPDPPERRAWRRSSRAGPFQAEAGLPRSGLFGSHSPRIVSSRASSATRTGSGSSRGSWRTGPTLTPPGSGGPRGRPSSRVEPGKVLEVRDRADGLWLDVEAPRGGGYLVLFASARRPKRRSSTDGRSRSRRRPSASRGPRSRQAGTSCSSVPETATVKVGLGMSAVLRS